MRMSGPCWKCGKYSSNLKHLNNEHYCQPCYEELTYCLSTPEGKAVDLMKGAIDWAAEESHKETCNAVDGFLDKDSKVIKKLNNRLDRIDKRQGKIIDCLSEIKDRLIKNGVIDKPTSCEKGLAKLYDELNQDDFEVVYYRKSHNKVNENDSCVRITHLESDVFVLSETRGGKYYNLKKAKEMMMTALKDIGWFEEKK